MKLKPYEDVMLANKDVRERESVQAYAKQAKKQGEVKLAQLEIEILKKIRKIEDSCYSQTLNFETIVEEMDNLALLQRQHSQHEGLLKELFSVKKK